MKIGIYSAEDPTAKSTWSGTPANLVEAFQKLGVPMAFCSSANQSPRNFVAKILARISPATSLFSKIGSKHLSNNLIENFQYEECDFVLHAPADHLPSCKSLTKSIHVAFIDATFKQFLFPWFKERYRRYPYIIRLILEIEMNRRNRYYLSTLKSVSHFFVTTSWTKKSLVEDYGIKPESITICYTGTGNISYKETDRKYNAPRILFVARHNYIAKGAKLLLESFRLVLSKHPEAELIIVGPNPNDLNVFSSEPQVSIYGFLPWDELEDLFNQCSLFVMPSEYEPYGLVYLEAMKCSMPVICSSTGGMASIVKEHSAGWVIDRLDSRELASLLDHCISNTAECRTRGDNGRTFVASNCSWDICAKKIKDQLDVMYAQRNARGFS